MAKSGVQLGGEVWRSSDFPTFGGLLCHTCRLMSSLLER